MKNSPMLLTAGILATTLSVSTVAETKKVVYEGDLSAKQVCSAIVHDKLGMLKRNLKMHKTHPFDKVHESFKCNDMDLDQFAQSQEAENITGYLERLYNRKTNVVSEEIDVAAR